MSSNSLGVSLTVVTVNLNNKVGLERTIESIRQLEVQDFKFAIIDGDSDDGSLEVMKNNSDVIDHFISEPDSGIYNAMNKAANVTNGDYILFLNSGDYFANPQVLNDINLGTGEDIIYGNHTYINPLTGKVGITKYDGNLDLGFFFRTTIPQCSTFIRRSCLDRVGWFSEDFPIVADWVFFCKAILEYDCSNRHVDKTIAIFELGGISTAPVTEQRARDEVDRFKKTFLPGYVYDYLVSSEALRQEKIRLEKELLTLQNELHECNRKSIRYRLGHILQRIKRRARLV